MKSTVKRLLCSALAALLLLALPVPADAAQITGYYCNTDIVAYVSGAPIRSYNINGWTGIVAEDLVKYGFDVVYDNDARHLSVIWADRPVTADYVPAVNTKPIGSRAGNIYKTDITVSLESWSDRMYANTSPRFSKPVSGWNIGGQTILLIDELLVFGSVVWDAQARTISFTRTPSWGFMAPDSGDADVSAPVDSFRVAAVNNGMGFTFSGENLAYLDQVAIGGSKERGLRFSFSVYGRVFMNTGTLLDKLPAWVSDGKGDYLRDASSGDMLLDEEAVGKYFTFTVNGAPVAVRSAVGGGGNNHRDYAFLLDCDLPWTDIQEVVVTCGTNAAPQAPAQP